MNNLSLFDCSGGAFIWEVIVIDSDDSLIWSAIADAAWKITSIYKNPWDTTQRIYLLGCDSASAMRDVGDVRAGYSDIRDHGERKN